MDFINTALTFPTAIYTGLLFVVIGFWLVSILGLVDIDCFEGDIDLTDGKWAIGFGGVPVTVSLSIVITLSWLCCFYIHQAFSYLLGDGVLFFFFSTLMLLASLFISLIATAIIIKPLRRFFENDEAINKDDLIGQECTVVTGKITENFGQARLFISGTEQLIEVRSDGKEVFKAGDRALLISHDSVSHTYMITTKPW